ncbi:hypothetical protein J3E72DRAFT_8050 [Bipolaris maydis]|nr:hypothetical protein J3E73DRAFT_237268 [Bipolaris maydis]KAJ5058509.1 hypothetical protein J3E74DRAFT_7267 [Bipolaris maydis]KAJ6195751.1 hypothetical protein J3E72DRAFT_8050 [Bipolaris maydis]KAJ6269242.1 hypothetical protein PSV08DRAFT_227064 [Bipolaris maydis]KAJ6280055.1 hypothetical protein J3E71DRAFT_354894 [Bipolaris maydis]
MTYFEIDIIPLHFNSKCITFSEWVALFTLCFAPLIAHLASGAPPISYLTDRQLKWYDAICIYNPTTIIWRYAAITDRRIRAINWSRQDFAASNAIFWTSNGWDGSEHMASVTAQYCLRYPETTHARPFSLTSLKTVITTLQGVSALMTLIGAISGSTMLVGRVGFGVDTIFFPLAILGLLRLCAAPWLTADYVYQDYGQRANSAWEMTSRSSPRPVDKDGEINVDESRTALDPLLVSRFQSAGFRSPESSWGSRTFRFFFLGLIWGVWVLAVFCILPSIGGGVTHYTTTSFLLSLYYFLFTSVTAITYTLFFLRGKTTNTILPCISSTWYRLYTVLFTGLMIGLIVIASIETNKTIDGSYTSWEPMEDYGCLSASDWWLLGPSSQIMGFASTEELDKKWLTQDQQSLPVAKINGTGSYAPEKFWLYNFTGYCLGRMN